jgi:hypothetical protein
MKQQFNKTREVIYEGMVKGQHHVLTIFKDGHKKSHYEYYVGIPKNHPCYTSNPIPGRGIISDGKNRWFKDPSGDKESELYKISKTIQFNSSRELKKAINSLSEPFRMSQTDINKFYAYNMAAMKYAWLSFHGNIYEFLKEDYCYYGGGMYIPSFGDKSCLESSKVALKLLGNYFLKVKDISKDLDKINVNFEGE